MKKIFDKCIEFDWDEGNSAKNRIRHLVSQGECEQVFFNEPIVVANNDVHSINESRWFLLGMTDSGRLLFVVFTVQGNRIRIISARDMNKKERKIYNEQA